MGVYTYNDSMPQMDPSVFVAPGAQIIGDVVIGPRSSVWFNAVIRGDVNLVRIGADTNIQDGVVVHVGRDPRFQTIIGDACTIGHNALIHGCTVGSHCIIGMGATILNGATIGENSIVAAGTVVAEGKTFPPGSVIIGLPGKLARSIRPDELERITRDYTVYAQLAQEYLKKGFKPAAGP